MSDHEFFRPSRPDGRSDRRVVYDLVHGAAPGTVFGYDVLTCALQDGVETPVERRRVYRAVGQANKTLLREDRRYLYAVDGVGYRVLKAEEQLAAAREKKAVALTMHRASLDLLQYVRAEEMPPEAWKAHEGHLMITMLHHQVIAHHDRKLRETDDLIKDVIRRVQRLEEDRVAAIG
jgi:hypothetical protein